MRQTSEGSKVQEDIQKQSYKRKKPKREYKIKVEKAKRNTINIGERDNPKEN